MKVNIELIKLLDQDFCERYGELQKQYYIEEKRDTKWEEIVYSFLN